MWQTIERCLIREIDVWVERVAPERGDDVCRQLGRGIVFHERVATIRTREAGELHGGGLRVAQWRQTDLTECLQRQIQMQGIGLLEAGPFAEQLKRLERKAAARQSQLATKLELRIDRRQAGGEVQLGALRWRQRARASGTKRQQRLVRGDHWFFADGFAKRSYGALVLEQEIDTALDWISQCTRGKNQQRQGDKLRSIQAHRTLGRAS